MASRLLYSVFVGHLPPETTKRELHELFSNCGNVVDLFINENEKGGQFKYGFVRYKELDSALQAMKELNRWKVRGEAIVVDISKDTRERIEREKLQMGDRLMTKETKKSTDVPRVKSSEFIQDVMHLSHLKEKCASLNFEVSKQKAGLAEKGDKALREIEVDKVLEYIAKTDKGRPKTISGQISEQPSLESVKDKLLHSDDVNEVEAKIRADTFMSILGDVMETVSVFVSDTNTGMKNQLQKNKDSLDQVSEQSQDKKSECKSCLSKSSSGMFSQGESDGCDDISRQKITGSWVSEKRTLSDQTGGLLQFMNDPDSDSSSVSSDDLDHRNRDSGVELDSSTNKFNSKRTRNGQQLPYSRQSSDEMPSLESNDSLIQKLQSSSSSGKLKSEIYLDSESTENGKELFSENVSQDPESVKLKRQTKSDGDLLVFEQNSAKSSRDSENVDFMDWVVNKLKESERDKNEDESKEDDGATGGNLSPRDKMVTSPQFQTYYLKAILGRGRGFNPLKSQTDDYWVRGGRWGRGGHS